MKTTWEYVLVTAEARGGILLTRNDLVKLYQSHPAEVDREAIRKGGPLLLDMVVRLQGGEDVNVAHDIRFLRSIFRDLA